MYFANPWGLLGLLALPAIVILHLYQRRYPPLLVGGLHLWGADSQIRQAGRRRDRLPITSSLLLELLAALLLSLVLAQPRFDDPRHVDHFVLVLDDSASMQARPPGEKSFRDAAIDEIDRRIEKLKPGSVATMIVTGRRPFLLAGPAVELTKARVALEAWKPAATAHDFEPAWDLATQLAEGGGQILFLTDHLPPKTAAVPKSMEIVSVGRPLENAAITAARWTFDSKTNKGRVFLRIANFGHRPADVLVRGFKGEHKLFERTLQVRANADAGLESQVAGGLGEITVKISSANDGLALDNEVTLIEPRVRTVTVAISLPRNQLAVRPLRRALAGVGDVQFGTPTEARLIFAPAADLPPPRDDLWWLGIGPIDSSAPARKAAKDIAGPYLLEKRHPLLDGIVLSGVVFGGVQHVHPDAAPLVTAGQDLVLGRLNGARASAYVLNVDFARSNLAESPDWPIFIKNLVELCRDSLPGLRRWNYRVNEEIAFRLDRGNERGEDARGPLTLLFDGKSRPVARGSVVQIPPLEDAGVYELRDGDRSIVRFAVNFHDPVESTLTSLGPGVRESVNENQSLGYRLDDPFSWLIAGGIVLIVIAVFADWRVLR